MIYTNDVMAHSFNTFVIPQFKANGTQFTKWNETIAKQLNWIELIRGTSIQIGWDFGLRHRLCDLILWPSNGSLRYNYNNNNNIPSEDAKVTENYIIKPISPLSNEHSIIVSFTYCFVKYYIIKKLRQCTWLSN